MEKKVLFTNWSNEDFSHTWGGEIISVPAQQTVELLQGVAEVLAYHLAVRELHKENKDVGSYGIAYSQKALHGGNVEVVETPSLEEEAIIEETPEEIAVEKEETPEEEVFEGLEEDISKEEEK